MALANPGVHSVDELDVVVDVLSAHGEPLGQNLMADKVINSDELSIESQENRAGLGAMAEEKAGRERAGGWLRVVWCSRKFILRASWISLVHSTSIAFLIPERFQSSARLRPRDQGSSRLAMLSASGIGAQLESGLSSLAGDLSRFQSSSALFVGIWQSRTVREDIINKLDLKTVDCVQRIEAAREQLSDRSRCFGPCSAPYETRSD